MHNQNPIDGQLTIIDSEGNEKLCQILFTLESEEFGKKYVVFYEVSELNDVDNDEDEIPLMAASYVETEDGSGELSEIETDEEWEYIQSAVSDFNNTPVDKDITLWISSSFMIPLYECCCPDLQMIKL